MKIGAWIHDSHEGKSLGNVIRDAEAAGLQSIRSYSIGYSQKAAESLKETGMSLLAGLHVDAAALVENWESQVRIDELSSYLDFGLTVEAFCVGNELREGGDEPDKKRFTSRLSYSLARVLETYRDWLARQGISLPLTYAMEGLVFDSEGRFKEHLWPLVDACDIISINSYPMSNAQWFGWGAFEESKRFLSDSRLRNLRFAEYELRLRRSLEELTQAGKPVILSETGFPSASGYRMEGEKLVVPIHDREGFGGAMKEFLQIVGTANTDYNGIIKAIYFYEWMDNYHHAKIWNVEESPIHTAFGLCDAEGKPKFDLNVVL